MSTWTQPICGRCYAVRYPGRAPTRTISREATLCCDCGNLNNEGIWLRVDPATVAHPWRPALPPGPDLVPVVSSNVKGIGYDAASRTMRVEYANDSVYDYTDISPEEHEQLMTAASVGKHLFHLVRGPAARPFTKVRG